VSGSEHEGGTRTVDILRGFDSVPTLDREMYGPQTGPARASTDSIRLVIGRTRPLRVVVSVYQRAQKTILPCTHRIHSNVPGGGTRDRC